MSPQLGNVPPAPPARELYPVNDAAEILGVSGRKVWTLISRGEIETKYLDGRRLIPREALLAFISQLPGDRPEFEAVAS